MYSLSCSPVVPLCLSTHKCGTAHSASHCLAGSVRPCLTGSPSHCLTWSTSQGLLRHSPPAVTLPQVFSAGLPVSTLPTGLDECFLFNSLVVGLLYSSIFWQFYLFLVFKFVVALVLVVQGGKVFLPTPPSWPEVHEYLVLNPSSTTYRLCGLGQVA